jgi:transcriptional regulator with XRE-family HTH domain
MYRMAASAKFVGLARQIEQLLVRNHWTQRELADRLGITQGHLSKLRSARVKASSKLQAKIKAAYSGVTEPQLDPWLQSVRLAGDKSRDAKVAIEAIARIIHKYS